MDIRKYCHTNVLPYSNIQVDVFLVLRISNDYRSKFPVNRSSRNIERNAKKYTKSAKIMVAFVSIILMDL